MAGYLFTQIATGKKLVVPAEQLEDGLLLAVGGHCTEPEVTMAMVLKAELLSEGTARSARFEITAIPDTTH